MTLKTQYWWLGINNQSKRIGTGRVVLRTEIAPLLNANALHFDWPTRGGRQQCYADMRPGDRVLLWMGHNPGGDPDWGLVGTATIASRAGASVRLVDAQRFAEVITPHAPGARARTTESDFLWDTFGADFQPLFVVYNRLGYFPSPRRRIITAYDVDKRAFSAVESRSHRRAAA